MSRSWRSRRRPFLDELRATEYARARRSPARRLSRLHRRQPLRRRRSSSEHRALLRDTGLRQPALGQPDVVGAPPRWSSGRARPCCAFFNAHRERVRLHLHRRTPPGALQARRRGIPVRAGRPVPADRPTTTTRSTASASSPARRARGALRAARAPDLRVDDAAASALPRRRDGRTRNLFAFPAQSNFSGVQHPLELDRRGAASAAGTCWSTPPRSCRPTGSTCRGATPDFVAVSFYKLFGYPTGLGCAARAPRRARHACAGPGSPAAPWSPRVGATLAVPLPARRPVRGRDASTTSASRRSRSGCATSSGSASTRSRARRRARDRGCSTSWAPAPRRRQPGGPRLRPGTWDGRGGTISFNFLHPDGRVVDERFVDAWPPAQDLRADRLLLQPGRGRGRVLALARRVDRRRVRRGMILDDFIALSACRRAGGAGLARVGQNFSDVYRFMAFATELLRPGGGPAAPAVQAGA